MKKMIVNGHAGRMLMVGVILIGLVLTGFAVAARGSNNAANPNVDAPLPPEKVNPAAVGSVMSLGIGSRDVKAGQTFNVTVMIDALVPTRAAQATIAFDPSLVKINGIVEGDYFAGWADANGDTTLNYPVSKLDNVQGTADTDVIVMGTTLGGPQGTGLLWTYSFTALKDGTVTFNLSNCVLSIPSQIDPHNFLNLTQPDLTVKN